MGSLEAFDFLAIKETGEVFALCHDPQVEAAFHRGDEPSLLILSFAINDAVDSSFKGRSFRLKRKTLQVARVALPYDSGRGLVLRLFQKDVDRRSHIGDAWVDQVIRRAFLLRRAKLPTVDIPGSINRS